MKYVKVIPLRFFNWKDPAQIGNKVLREKPRKATTNLQYDGAVKYLGLWLPWLPALTLILLGACKQGPRPDTANEAAPKKPNIVLILADDLGYETLGINGADTYKTPNLDRLAMDGIRFTQCYATPLCTPSRVQLMTGKYNFRNYIGFGLLDPGQTTFAQPLKAAGYATFAAGKWQLLGNDIQRQLAGGKIGSWPEQAGFDEYCLWQVNERGSRYKNPHLTFTHRVSKDFPNGFGPDIFVDEIQRFMTEHRDGPMFIYYPMALTHDPFVPMPDSPAFAGFEPEPYSTDPIYFGAMVHYMDALIGRIVKKAESLGILDNTLILFVGDNGTDRNVVSTLDGQEIRGDKGHTTTAGTHVPFIAYWQGKTTGTVNDDLIDLTDFFPSILEVTGAKSNAAPLDGISFAPKLLGKDSPAREWIFCDYHPRWGNFEARRYVQDKKLKLYDDGSLFDLVADPMEKSPLPIDSQPDRVLARVNDLRAVLDRMR